MTKETLITCYQFLGENVKIGALSNATTRAAFIKFFRELRKLVLPIYEEIKAVNEPPLDQAPDETHRQILGETVEGDLPKIKEDFLLDVLAENKLDVPVIAILNSFEELIEN